MPTLTEQMIREATMNACLASGLTHQQIADAIGASRSNVTSFLNGRGEHLGKHKVLALAGLMLGVGKASGITGVPGGSGITGVSGNPRRPEGD